MSRQSVTRRPCADPVVDVSREGGGVRVAVIGCGAVGSLFAAALAQLDDVEVWVYDLDAAHVARSTATVCGSPEPAS